MFLADFHLLEPAQCAQPHVENGFGLHFVRENAFISIGFGSSSVRMIAITLSRLR